MNSKYDQISRKIADHVRLTLEYCCGVTYIKAHKASAGAQRGGGR